jgi:uncharacterized membrane protein HdeD (DUF308 family)
MATTTSSSAARAADGRLTEAQMEPSSRMLMLRGVIAILFGVLAFALPGVTLIWLVALFAIYALLGGIVSIGGALETRRVDRRWWLPLLLGIVSIAAAVYAVAYPGLTALVLVLVMGANAIFTGALDLAIAIRLRNVLRGVWLMVLSGIVSILFGMFVFAAPGAGALALVWLISLHAVVTGVLLLTLGLRARRAAHDAAPHHAVPAGGR